MAFVLYLLLSGDVLLGGLGLVALGLVLRPWRGKLAVVLAWTGLVLAFASAVPVHFAAYLVLLLAMTGWYVRPSRVSTGMLMLVVTGVLVQSVWWRHGSAPILPRDKAVFVVGDSLSAGLGVSKEGTWPQLVSEQLGMAVTNLSQAGATLAAGLRQSRAVPAGAVIVLVELGGNDVLAGVDPDRFRSDLRTLLNVLAVKDRVVVMFELPLLPSQYSYGRIQRDAAREYGVGLIPRRVLAGAVALPRHTIDGVHLSAEGHAWVARRVAQVWRSA